MQYNILKKRNAVKLMQLSAFYVFFYVLDAHAKVTIQFYRTYFLLTRSLSLSLFRSEPKSKQIFTKMLGNSSNQNVITHKCKQCFPLSRLVQSNFFSIAKKEQSHSLSLGGCTMHMHFHYFILFKWMLVDVAELWTLTNEMGEKNRRRTKTLKNYNFWLNSSSWLWKFFFVKGVLGAPKNKLVLGLMANVKCI